MNMDIFLQTIVSGLNQFGKIKHKFYPSPKWQPGKTLRLLLVGYTGTRNTGSDVRTAEIVRQLQHLLRPIDHKLTVVTFDPRLSAGYFDRAKQILIPQIFPAFLAKECSQHDGVIACEGSMFKSQFATALSTMLAGALGVANTYDKLSVGYGAEAGKMESHLKKFVRNQCKKSLIICRNEHSRSVLDELNIRSASGTDTAWTFDPGPITRGTQLLREAGWDGKKMLLAIAPINPFWWPVTPDLKKAFMHFLTQKYNDQHYKSIYFHHHSKAATERYQYYIQSIAESVSAFCQKHNAFPILIGMERLDGRACALLSEKLGGNIPQFVSDKYNMFEMVSILRHADLLLSSRFHAIVTSMPALVPSAGITMDERIYNLMNDRNHLDFVVRTDETDLSAKINAMLEKLYNDRDKIKQDMARNVTQQIKMMGNMGKIFMTELERVYPASDIHVVEKSWENYLPTLPTIVTNLLEANA